MQMKPACSFPMRESLLDQLLNRFIALHKLCPRLLLAPFAFGTRVTQQRSACRRRRDQVNAFECLALLSEDVLDDFGQIAQHMEPIRCLERFGSPKARRAPRAISPPRSRLISWTPGCVLSHVSTVAA